MDIIDHSEHEKDKTNMAVYTHSKSTLMIKSNKLESFIKKCNKAAVTPDKRKQFEECAQIVKRKGDVK
jgi:hypothetical protein